MCYHLTSSEGTLEAVVDNNCGIDKFFDVARTLIKERHIKFVAKEDYSDTIDWFFNYDGRNLILHYNACNGISISCNNSRDDEAVKQLVLMLQEKCF